MREYGPESRFYEQSLYKLGWSQFKLAWHDDSLYPFFELLDRKIGDVELQEGDNQLAGLSRAEQEIVEDTFRVLSISFSYMEGADSIDAFMNENGQPEYAYVIYRNLGDLYLDKQRFQDAAVTYEAFVGQDPYHPKAPLLQVEVIEAYKQGGFPSLVLEGKKGFVERYGMDGPFWVRNPREQNEPVAVHLKSNLTDLAQYYHAEAQKDGKKIGLPGSRNAGTASTWRSSRKTRTRPTPTSCSPRSCSRARISRTQLLSTSARRTPIQCTKNRRRRATRRFCRIASTRNR